MFDSRDDNYTSRNSRCAAKVAAAVGEQSGICHGSKSTALLAYCNESVSQKMDAEQKWLSDGPGPDFRRHGGDQYVVGG